AIFGTGWAISGYCPGTCLVGTAEGKFDAVATLIGGLVGALIFAWAFPMLDELLLQNANFGKITIQGLLGINGLYLAVPFSFAMLFAAFFLLKDRYE
ncbi:MAG: YeeE/YedE family protein, partial [Pseudomonadales bacterium]|nr:YeeE/YedE family protein [Pseudomonadales bacterium]